MKYERANRVNDYERVKSECFWRGEFLQQASGKVQVQVWVTWRRPEGMFLWFVVDSVHKRQTTKFIAKCRLTRVNTSPKFQVQLPFSSFGRA